MEGRVVLMVGMDRTEIVVVVVNGVLRVVVVMAEVFVMWRGSPCGCDGGGIRSNSSSECHVVSGLVDSKLKAVVIRFGIVIVRELVIDARYSGADCQSLVVLI